MGVWAPCISLTLEVYFFLSTTHYKCTSSPYLPNLHSINVAQSLLVTININHAQYVPVNSERISPLTYLKEFIITVEDGVPFAKAKQAIASTGVTITHEMPFLRVLSYSRCSDVHFLTHSSDVCSRNQRKHRPLQSPF